MPQCGLLFDQDTAEGDEDAADASNKAFFKRVWWKAMVVTPSLVLREREASPLTAQMPRNSATELSTTSFFLFILAHKGDIMGVNVQLEQSKHFHFHLNYENGKEKRSPLTN